MTIELGFYVQDEVPSPLEYEYQDAAGVTIDDIDDDDWTVVFRWKVGGDSFEGEASADSGVVTYVWQPTDMATAGVYRGEFHATNGTNTFISERILWVVAAEIPAPTS